MFTRVFNFLYNHRRKFIFAGAVVGTAALLRQYAERKLFEWQEQQTHLLLEKQKRNQHFENTCRTANATVLSLASSVEEVLGRELDTDALLQAVREQPQHKLQIWEQLKVVGFSRAIATVYVSALLATAVRVQLMLLAGHTFGDLLHRGNTPATLSQGLQQRYLAAVHYLVEEGVPRLVRHLTLAVTHVVAGLPLSRSLTLAQLEGILHEVRLHVAGVDTAQAAGSGPVERWSSYVLKAPTAPEGPGPEEAILYNMLIETLDVLDSEDFGTIMTALIHRGINIILDRMADFYPIPKLEPATPAENWVDRARAECSPPSPPSPHTQGQSQGNEVPVAKLVPVLSGVVHAALSPAPGQLLHQLLTHDKLDTLGANVYEAFAVSRSP